MSGCFLFSLNILLSFSHICCYYLICFFHFGYAAGIFIQNKFLFVFLSNFCLGFRYNYCWNHLSFFYFIFLYILHLYFSRCCFDLSVFHFAFISSFFTTFCNLFDPFCFPWVIFFFSLWVFFHNHSRITGLQGMGEGISLSPHYYFHPLHRNLDISRAITEKQLTSAHR